MTISCSMFCLFKQKTAYELRISDWSSDVCSSDLRDPGSSPWCRWRQIQGLRRVTRRDCRRASIIDCQCLGGLPSGCLEVKNDRLHRLGVDGPGRAEKCRHGK